MLLLLTYLRFFKGFSASCGFLFVLHPGESRAAAFRVCLNAEGIIPGWLQGKCNSRVGNCALTSVPAVFCGEAVWVCLCKLWLHRHCFKADLSTEAELSILTLGLPTLLSAEVQWYLTHRGSHSQESFVRLGCTWKLGILPWKCQNTCCKYPCSTVVQGMFNGQTQYSFFFRKLITSVICCLIN